MVKTYCNKRAADIDDIDKALKKLKCGHALPLILASSRMVHKAPVAKGIPLDANAGDIVNRVTMLENSLTTFMKQQNEQMTNLTNSIGAIGPAPPSALNTKAFKHVKVVNLDSPGKRKRLEENEEAVEVEKDDASKHLSYASVAQLKKVGTGNVPGIKRMEQTDNRQRKPSIMYGTSKVGKDDTEELLAADVSLVASGVSKDATAEQLKEFIEGKGIGVIEIVKLTKEDAETRTNTFKIVVKLSDYEKAMQPEVWPYRVGVRHYKPQRRNQQGMSWQQQSQQAGGQPQQRQQPPARVAGGPRAPRAAKPSFTLDVSNKYQILTDENGEVFIVN